MADSKVFFLSSYAIVTVRLEQVAHYGSPKRLCITFSFLFSHDLELKFNLSWFDIGHSLNI